MREQVFIILINNNNQYIYKVSAGSKGKRDLEDAKKAIHELLTKIKDIQIKAEKSETMVTEICRFVIFKNFLVFNFLEILKI